MHSLRATVVGFLVAAVVLLLVGCGGGGEAGPPGPSGTIRLEGRVVAADNTAMTFAGAEVTVLPTGQTVVTDGLGRFAFAGLESTPLTVQVNPVYSPQYQPGAVVLPALTANYLTLNIALLPRSAGSVTALAITPQDQVVEAGALVPFSAGVVTSTGASGLNATWVALGRAGSIDANGLFTAAATGQSTILAFCGDQSAMTTIRVVAERPPTIGEVQIDPAQLPPQGGSATVTVPLGDADGVATAVALIATPSGRTVRLPMALVAGTAQDGTWRVSYNAPAAERTGPPLT